MAYDRYKNFRVNGKVGIPPMIEIVPKSSDFFETYIKGESRLDLISYDYYGDPGYDWLIMMANSSIGDLEYDIPDGAEIRIPYPLNTTLENYKAKLDIYNNLYGID